ncbi:MAG TPA: hypothetical protein VIL36_22430 [Acidimicrobiales bacterium]
MGKTTMRRLAALGGAALLLVGTACGDDDDQAGDDVSGVELEGPDSGAEAGGFEASPGYLTKVVEQSTGESYRYEMTLDMELDGRAVDFGGPIATGEFDGTRNHMRMDMGVMFEGIMGSMGGDDLPPGMSMGDLTIEYVVDTDAMYIRAPFFGAMMGDVPPGAAESLGGAGSLLTAFASMGDGWGKVDVAALGDVLPGEAAGALGGGQAYDPQVLLELIRGSEDAEALGTDEIDGVPVNGIAAEVDMAEMLEVQGLSPEDLGSAGDMADVTFPIEVWVGPDDLIRRVNFTFDDETMADLGGGDTAGLGGMSVSMDFLDYGGGFDIEVPSGDEVIDITEDFVAGYEAIDDLTATGGLPS